MSYIHTINIKKYPTPKIPSALLKTKEITITLFQAHEAASKIYPIIIVYIQLVIKHPSPIEEYILSFSQA
jgi:hypothetical protein